MYLQNKYTRIYNLIIERAQQRTLVGYTEKHHVIPKSLGGSDSKDNLVELTSKEHFICHRLLTKITTGEERRKMLYAMKIMTTTNHHGLSYVPNARTFEYVREQARLAQLGVPCKEETKEKIRRARAKQITTKETREKMRKAHTGRVHSEETKQKIRESAAGRKLSPETIAKIKEARAKQIITTINVTCPHCGKTGGNRIMPRYHFDNCKFKV